jgi:hypothetical protein
VAAELLGRVPDLCSLHSQKSVGRQGRGALSERRFRQGLRREGARRDQNQALFGGHGEGSGESAALRHRFGQRTRAATS